MSAADTPLEGKAAIVMGGGIGRKFAEALGGAGASVMLADINLDSIKTAAAGYAFQLIRLRSGVPPCRFSMSTFIDN